MFPRQSVRSCGHRAHDLPVFREAIKSISDGTGCVMMLDAGHDANKTQIIWDSGRKPVICTRKNHTVKGFGIGAEMLRWQEKSPEEFEKTYRRMVESVFLSLKKVYCSSPCKEPADPKAAVVPQVCLL